MSEDVIVPVRSKGYTTQPTDSTYFYTDLQSEHVPDLVWPLSVDVYRRMRKDPVVASILRAVIMPLLRVQWRVEQAGASDEVTRFVADELGLPIIGQPARPPVRRRGRFSWSEHVRLALTMLPFGAAFFEQEAVYNPGDGRAHLHRLGFRPLATLAEPPKVARDGGLVSIKQTGIASEASREIPVGQLVAYVHQREGGNWLGESVLRPAYQPYLLRDRLIRTDTIKNDRFAGTPVYTSGRDDGGDMDAGADLMKAMRLGDTSGMSQPRNARSEILTPTTNGPDTLKSIEYHDRRIAGTVLGQWMTLGQQTSSSGSSYALGAVQVNEFSESLETINSDLADIANAHVVEDLVDWNWGPSEPAPRLVPDDISERWTAQMLEALARGGYLFPDRPTEEWLRQSIGAPPKDQPPPQEATT